MNKVVVIGLDHSNTLGVVRSLGENGVKPYLFIISDTKFVATKHSKYCLKKWVCKDEEEAIFTMIQEFENVDEKIVVIPTSDKAASILDSNLNRLSKKFILQNINNEENRINMYMDKFQQYKLAIDNNVLVAQSIVIEYPFENNFEFNLKFPVIIKPLVSADGQKIDISIASTYEELKERLMLFKTNNYKNVIVQEYIDFEYECDMSGFIYDKKVSVSGYIKKNRIWPQKKGSLTFGTVQKKNRYKKEINKITDILRKINFSGLFDVEFFVKGDRIYLNEINFRNSGLTYLYGNSYICYYYYLSCINNKFIPAPEIDEEYNVMDDQAELHQIIDKNITLKEHKKDKHNSKQLLVANKFDPIPSKMMLINKMINNLGLKKVVLLLEKGIHKSKKCYLLKSTQDDLTRKHVNNDYKVIELDNKTIELLPDFKKDIIDEFSKGQANGIILTKNGEYIGRGIIKSQEAKDRFISIKSANSYLICNVLIYPKFRGKNYQCDLILELVKRYIEQNNFNIYSVVYKYNIPSWKNFLKIGFKIDKEFKIIRVLKKTINKEKI